MAASGVRRIVATVGTRFLGKSANFLVLAILARALSIADLGVYGYVFIASMLASVACDVGVRNSVAHYMGQEPDKANDRALQALLLFIPFSVLGLIATPLVMLSQVSAIPLHVALAPVMLNVVSMLFIRMEQGILLGNGQISHFNRTELASRTVLLGATVAVYVLHDITLLTALYILAISNLCGAVAVAIAIWPTVRAGSMSQWAGAKRLVARGFVFMLGVVAMLATQKITFLVLSLMGADGEAGLFYGIQRLTDVMTEIGIAVSVVIFSNSVRAESKQKAIRDVAESTRLCLILFAGLALVAYVLAPYLLPIALGKDFSGHEGLFRIVLIGTLVGTVWTIIFPPFTTIEHPMVGLLIMLPNLVGSGVLTWALYEAAGITGAAWAMVASQAALTASLLLAFKIRHGVKVRTFLVVSLADLQGIRMPGRRRRKKKELQH